VVAVSVVMPVRDALASVPAAVGSLLGQSMGDWELVVVDDGSIDGTGEWLVDLANRESRVRVVRTGALGIVSALRTGCELARGRYVARMDADDVMAVDRLEKQVGLLEVRPEVGLVSCLVGYGGEGAGYATHVGWINGLVESEAMALRRFVEAPVAHPSVMFRRELLGQFGGYGEGMFPEDYELWLRWMEAGVRFAKVPEVLLTWNDPPGRLSRTDARYSMEVFFEMKAGYLARWLQREVAQERAIWLCGAGRVTRRRFAALGEYGVRLAGYVDVDPAKVGRELDGLPVVGLEALPEREGSFLLGGVGTRGVREALTGGLVERGGVEGSDCLLVA
jgi:glycosyltransferase involved in cell wall biosynthesis